MKKAFQNIALALALATLSFGSMASDGGGSDSRGWQSDGGRGWQSDRGRGWRNDRGRGWNRGNGRHNGNGHSVESVPEIDVAGAGIALALTAGLVAIFRERRRSVR